MLRFSQICQIGFSHKRHIKCSFFFFFGNFTCSEMVVYRYKIVFVLFFIQRPYRASFIILYRDQQMHNYFTSYHTATCFDTIVSSSGSL